MKDGRCIVRVSLDMLNVIIRRPRIVTVIYGYFILPDLFLSFLFPSNLLLLPLSFFFVFFFFFQRSIFFPPSCSRNKSRWESTQRRQFHSKDWRPMVRKLTRKHANSWRIRGVAGHSRLFTMKGARTWPHPMFIRLCFSSRQSTMFLAHSLSPCTGTLD